MARKLDIITLILLILSFISWVVLLAGTAAYDAEIRVQGYMVGYAWWAVWFQCVVLVFVGLTACMGNIASRLRTDLTLMVTVVLMQIANDARVKLDSPMADVADWLQTELTTDMRVLLAGSILCLIFNFVLIIYWGLTENSTQPLSLGRRAGVAGPEPVKVAEAMPAQGPTV